LPCHTKIVKMKIFTTLFSILLFLVSYSQDYKISWQECIRTENYGISSRCVDVIGSNYIVGVHTSEPYDVNDNYHGMGDALYIMIDSLGNNIWAKCYGGFDWDEPKVVIYDNSKSVYLINETESTNGDVSTPNLGGYDIWVVKIDLDGNIIWEKSYGGLGHDEPRAAILTQDGGVLIMSRIQDGGGQVSNFYGYYDNWIIKLDSLGNLEWETTIGSIGMDNGLKLLLTSHDTYIALCGVNDNGGMSECTMMNDPVSGLDLWLVELDLDGNIISQDCYGGTFDDLGRDIVETDIGYTIVSSSDSDDYDVSGNHGQYDMWLLNISFEREIQWQKCLGGSSYDKPTYLNIDQNGDYIVIGYTDSHGGDVINNHGETDVWFVKTDQYGNILWQNSYGDLGSDWFEYGNCVTKKNDFTYLLAPVTYGINGDVNCIGIMGGRLTPWVFELRDCHHYASAQPQQPTGKDTLCVNTDSITIYTTPPATFAWYYEWQLQPEEAGTTLNDSITTTINWNPNYEGPAILKVRSSNDCGESAWSDSLVVNTYICLGNEENELGKIPAITVYPNPAKTKLYIKYNIPINNKQAKVEIFDNFGVLISTFQVGKNLKGYVDVSNWSTGLYFVRVIENGKTIGVKKVVVE